MSNEIKNNAWLKYSGAEREKIFDFCEGYKNYLSVGKTERAKNV